MPGSTVCASRGSLAALMFAAAVAACGNGGGPGGPASVRGRAWVGGPLVGARVQVYQLVNGERTGLLDEATTGAAGDFELTADGYEHFELVVGGAGGSYQEIAGGTVTVPADVLLRGAVLNVGTGEVRDDVAVTPFTEVLVGLAQARARGGQPFNEALPLVRDRLAAHLGFDPTQTSIGELGGPLAANGEPTRHALALAGLSTLAAGVADDLGVSVQDVNTLAFARALATDAAGAEARLDGNVDERGVVPLHVGPACAADVAGARASCRVQSNTLRARLAAGVLGYLLGPGIRTGLGKADVLSWLEAMAANTDAALFAGDGVEPIDQVDPTLAWERPAAGARLGGDVAVEVIAADDLGVASIEVRTAGAMPRVLVDTDPSAERFVATLATAGLPEGPLTLQATARDRQGRTVTSERLVAIDNLPAGRLSGVASKGRLRGARVKVFDFTGGVRGAQLGMGVTDAQGVFVNVEVQDGYSGPLLVEAGFGGTYNEEAEAGVSVALDVDDALATVVPAYHDGTDVAMVALSPGTTLAVAYLGWLTMAQQGGADLAARWTTAVGTLEAHLGTGMLTTTVPLAPAEMQTVTAGARAGLIAIGLSELARRASTLGGGDAGNYGTSIHAMKVLELFARDLGDGCWDGIGSGVALSYGGTQVLGQEGARRGLATAIAAYLSSSRDHTPFATADVIALLETLARGGATTAPGSCAGGTMYPPGTGAGFDQTPPVVTFTAPVAGAMVRGTVTIDVAATDLTAPTTVFTAPAPLVGVDSDGDATDADAHALFDTRTVVPGVGPLTISARATDLAGNAGMASVQVTVDNVPPVVTVASAGYFVDGAGAWWPLPTGSPPTAPGALVLGGSVTEDYLDSVVAKVGGAVVATATVSGPSWTLTLPVGTVPGVAPIVVEIVATDRAGNVTTVSKTLRRDDSPPVLTVEQSSVRTERPGIPAPQGEIVTFDPTPPAYKVSHTHNSAPVSLDADMCASAPSGWTRVAKYAYLLDDATPAYADEPGGRNPLVWNWRVTDDGVGVAVGAVRYRVLDSGGAALTGWRPVAPGAAVVENGVITGSHYQVELHRRGVDAIPQLEQGGAVRIEFDASDRLGRVVSTARCIQLEVLPTPVDFGAPQAATSGPVGSGKFGLSASGLSLAGSIVEQPFAAQVLNATTSGNGLMEYRVTNPTTEDAYLTIDFTRPTTASTTVSYRRDQPMYFDAQPADFYCSAATPCGSAPAAGTLISNQSSSAVPRYGVQVWAVDRSVTPAAWTRVPECATCNLTAPTAGQLRTTVRLPGRTTPAALAAEYWVVPVVYELVGLRPGSTPPYEDRDFWSGKVTSGGSYCSVAVNDGLGLHCDELTSYQKVNYVTQATFSLGIADVITSVQLSRVGGLVEPLAPPLYINGGATYLRSRPFNPWSTAEP